MFARITKHRLGSAIGRTRTIIGNIDRGIRTAARVYHAVKDHVPDSKIKKAAERGLSDYESVREKIRSASQP